MFLKDVTLQHWGKTSAKMARRFSVPYLAKMPWEFESGTLGVLRKLFDCDHIREVLSIRDWISSKHQ